ncbi:hypothetical protein [Limnohabitans sp.]|uniref:hypothetical protein n=1 Tax=Limnohabitans sp. TaxID=1907725 RepID=UPI0025BA7DF0|nr:hypothetical protein [Limnohabitans sp.]
MKFTEFVVTETAGNSVDPLGYLKPSGEVSSGLFRSFTVLSNHPAYHGFLAFAFSFLEKMSIKSGQKNFVRRMRDLEILWGVLSVHGGDPVINVTKYEPLTGQNSLCLDDAKKRPALYARLNYGALGHYVSPSTTWRILQPNGGGLSANGSALAEAWQHRNGFDFADLANRWMSGADLFAEKKLGDWARAFRLGAEPEPAERKAWQTLIHDLCRREPVIAPLWEKLVTEDILALGRDEDTYPRFFPGLLGHYAAHPELCRRIKLCNRFEQLSSLVQFVFEWEYVRRLDHIQKIGMSANSLPSQVSNDIRVAAHAFRAVQGLREFWVLPSMLENANDYPTIVATVLASHSAHQRAKGASPFITGDAIAVQDRVDGQKFMQFFKSVADAPETLVSATQWRYHRNWHFERALLWQRYAGIQ